MHSFFPSSIRLWNRLPSEIKLSPDLLKFKSAVQNFPLMQPISNHDFFFYKYSTMTIAQSNVTLNFLALSHPNFWSNFLNTDVLAHIIYSSTGLISLPSSQIFSILYIQNCFLIETGESITQHRNQ